MHNIVIINCVRRRMVMFDMEKLGENKFINYWSSLKPKSINHVSRFESPYGDAII